MLQLHEDVVNLISKYCEHPDRNVKISTIVERVARNWIRQGYQVWKRKPEQVKRNLKTIKTPDSKVMTIKVQRVVAENFLRGCNKLDIDPIKTLSFLAKMWIKKFNLETFARYKPKNTFGRRKYRRLPTINLK